MNIINITLNELKLVAKDRISLALVLVMPILMILLMGYALKPSFEAVENADIQPVSYRSEGEAFLSYSKGYETLLTQYHSFSTDESREEALGLLFAVESSLGRNFVSLEKPQGMNSQITSFQHFSASMLIFFLLTTGMGLGMNIVKERLDKTYMRICSFAVKKSEYLLGKLIGNACIGILQSMVILVVTAYAFDVEWGNSYFGIALNILLIIFISSAFGILFSSILNSPKAVTGGLTVIFWLMTFISGGFTGMAILEPLPSLTANKWAFDAITKMMVGGGLGSIRAELFVLTLMAVGLWITSVFLYNRRVSHE